MGFGTEVRSAGAGYCSHFPREGFAVFLLAVSLLDALSTLGRLPGPLRRFFCPQLCHLPLLALKEPGCHIDQGSNHPVMEAGSEP